MIAFIEGNVAELTPTYVVLEAGGIGYDINITLADYSKLRDRERAKLRITEIIREDAFILYGFLNEDARLFFDKLRTVSGVGPATARLILSSFTPAELAALIDAGAVELLQTVKGIGLKTAQRIVVDLKGKLILDEGVTGAGGRISSSLEAAQAYDDALRALKNLGYPDAAVKKELKKLFESNPIISLEEMIRSALKSL